MLKKKMFKCLKKNVKEKNRVSELVFRYVDLKISNILGNQYEYVKIMIKKKNTEK